MKHVLFALLATLCMVGTVLSIGLARYLNDVIALVRP